VRYDNDRAWLAFAIELSALCPHSESAFCVGAVLVSQSNQVIATGYSRETDPKAHAEEVALAKAEAEVLGQAGVTLYSSLEPCLTRASRPVSCAELIVRGGIKRVVIAWREPPLFQPGGGAAWLERQGVAVVEVPELAGAARAVNRAVLDQG
jgi:diaminohydroxyphosphoribosylaminopyrimidine deaminase/5-amino-6-(5-phosphoribosylamino)uracil reductase